MTGWREIKLKDVCEHVTVGFVGSMADFYEDSGIPFLRSLNIHPFRLNFQDLKFIGAEFHHKLRKSALKPGDVAVVRTGYPGTAAVIPKSLGEANCSDLVLIRPSKELNSHFLAAIFNSTFGKSLVSGNLVGAAQQHFNITVAKELRLRMPSKKEQDKIAAILTAYDDLIEVNQRRIAALETMAEELYREWFVRLRFPGHAKVKLVKGVPEGWDILPFTQIADINPTERLPKDEDVPYVGMDALSTSSMYFVSDERRKNGSGSKFRNRDVLVPRITPCLENGKRGFTMTLAEGELAVGSTEFIVVREKLFSAEHLYLLTCTNSFRLHAELSMTGASGRQRVQEDCFSFFWVPIPPEPIRERFTAIVKPIFQLVHQLSLQSDSLRQTRDLLLPRLISGKLRVEALDIQFPPGMAD